MQYVRRSPPLSLPPGRPTPNLRFGLFRRRRRTFWLAEDLYTRLRERAALEHRSITALVVIACEQYLKGPRV